MFASLIFLVYNHYIMIVYMSQYWLCIKIGKNALFWLFCCRFWLGGVKYQIALKDSSKAFF